MAHTRERQLKSVFQKRLKISRVVFINGARQTGKSFFARELLSSKNNSVKYLTLDSVQQFALASQSPTQFLNQKDFKEQTLIVDEAQRVPSLFQVVKEIVDVDTRPGQFILLGSTEFSHRSNVQESLTGRASPLTMYPFNLSEIKHLPLKPSLNFQNQETPRASLSDVLQYLERGGLPGIFSIREKDARLQLCYDWIDLTVNRDIFQIKGSRFEPIIAKQILEAIAQLDDTSASEIAKKIRVSTQKIKTYLAALKALFVIVEVPIFPGSSGKNQFVLCDCGIAKALNATQQNLVRTWFLNEIQSQSTYRSERFETQIYTFRGSKGGRVDFVIKMKDKVWAIKLFTFEKLVHQDFEILRSFKTKNPESELIALAPVSSGSHNNGIQVLPYESMV